MQDKIQGDIQEKAKKMESCEKCGSKALVLNYKRTAESRCLVYKQCIDCGYGFNEFKDRENREVQKTVSTMEHYFSLFTLMTWVQVTFK